MQNLQNSFRIMIELTPMNFFRPLHYQINWNNRLLGILGQKGVGKSTLILQHIKRHDNIDETLYVQADDLYFSTHNLFELAYNFFKIGGKKLYVDEIHKYKGWSIDIKQIYDQLPLLSVVYSGSSILDLERGGADLSRRTVEYYMPGLSFREFLNISKGWNLSSSPLEDILKGKVDFPYKEHRPLMYFERYLKTGYYPFFQEPDFFIRLNRIIRTTIEYDIPKYANMPVASAEKLKKLMYVIAQNVPFKPNYSELERDLSISRNTFPQYIQYLEKAQLLSSLREKAFGDAIIRKIEKIYLNNPNVAYALSDSEPNIGNIRETIFLTWMKEKYVVQSSSISDFEIEGKTFEIGGRSKSKKQVLQATEGYVVKDDIEYASGNIIPLWMFGFVY